MRSLKVVDSASHPPGAAADPPAPGSGVRDESESALLLRLVELVGELQAEVQSLRRPAAAVAPSFLIVRNEHRFHVIDVNDIELIEADGNYVRLRVGQQCYRRRAALGAVERKLGTRRFARVHRSSIVNLAAVRCVTAWFSGDYIIELKSGARVKVSRTYWQQLTRRLGLD